MSVRIGCKQRAKELISTSKPSVITAGLIYLLISLVLSFLAQEVLGVNYTQETLLRFQHYMEAGQFEQAADYLETLTPSGTAYLIGLLLELVGGVVGAGFVLFLLRTIRQTGASYGNLLDGFGMFWRILGLTLLESLLIFLWSSLLIVPGIIASYRYRMALYLLLDHPELSVTDCLRRSSEMMQGRKMELFVFDLSFLGWRLLALFPVLGVLVQCWSVPFINMSYALYYEQLRSGEPLSEPV